MCCWPHITMTKLNKKLILAKQVRRKSLTQGFLSSFWALIQLGKLKSKCVKQYMNAYYCSSTKLVREGKLTNCKLCKTRMCQGCNAIRSANLINGYSSQLEPYLQQGNLFFLTLTQPTTHYIHSKQRLNDMMSWWRRTMVCRSVRHQAKMVGLRKLEATVRPNGHIHWHYHIVVVGKENAEWLQAKWLKDHQNALPQCQKLIQAGANPQKATKNHLNELFKYVTKPSYKDSRGKEVLVPDEEAVYAYDAIFQAAYRRRLVQPFGGLRKITEEIEEDKLEGQELLAGHEGKIWQWHRGILNYVSEYGEILAPEVRHPAAVVKRLACFSDPPEIDPNPYKSFLTPAAGGQYHTR